MSGRWPGLGPKLVNFPGLASLWPGQHRPGHGRPGPGRASHWPAATLIPSEPFETITMDFITELPNSDGYDAILVIIDKLTKYGMFIPVHTVDTAAETAQVVFQQVVAHYGIPREIVSDRDNM